MSDTRPGILIAEDDEEIRNLLTLVFELENFSVYEAEDGQAALDLFSEHTEAIQVVVTDLGLPVVGGIDLIESIRHISPTVKIIGASGFGHDNIRSKVLASGGDAFLAKPFVTAELLALAKKLIGI